MTDKPSEDDKPDDAAFQRTLENMLKTPPTPHKPIGGGERLGSKSKSK